MGLGPVPIPARGVRHSGAGDVGVSAGGPFGIRSGAGPCRPSRSVTRREKPGQTRSPSRLCRPPPAGAVGGSAAPAPILPPCDPTTHVRVSLRDRRDARPHPDHLPCHPDVRRPAVQGPAAVDGAHAGARPVRPRGQADAPLRHLQARRHRRLHAARRLGRSEDGTPFIKRVIGLGGDTVEIHDGERLHQRHQDRRAVPVRARARRSAATDERPRRRALGHPGRRALPDGRPPRELGRLAEFGPVEIDAGHRSRLAALLAARRLRDPPTPTYPELAPTAP